LGFKFLIGFFGQLNPLTQVCFFIKDTEMRNSLEQKISPKFNFLCNGWIWGRFRGWRGGAYLRRWAVRARP